MNLAARLDSVLRAARRRRIGIALALGLPWAVPALAWLVRRSALPAAALAGLVAGWLLLVTVWALRRARTFDRAWLARRLDRERPELEDSSALLFSESAALSGLAGLQRLRVERRLRERPLPPLRPAWPWRTLLLGWTGATALAVAGLGWPPGRIPAAAPVAGTPVPAAPGKTEILHPRLAIEPPAYTGLAAYSETALAARVPEGSKVRWRFGLTPMPVAASLRFHDGTELALSRDGDEWAGERVLAAPALYRLHVESAPPPADDRLYRLDTVPDRAPEIRVSRPERTLSLIEAADQGWVLEFQARDDYGLGAARLDFTLAQGGGENIAFTDTALTLRGEGELRRRRYAWRLDPARFGLAPGDELIVRLSVRDNRRPQPQIARHPSFILRWPPPPGGETGALEGIVQRALPAYFRSQRQIILDSEALLDQRPQVTAETYVDRSDAIGVDQHILRLRYGQFLGEEAESGRLPAGGDADHDHEAEAVPAPERFGDAAGILAEFGHSHDQAEAATLFDPETRRLLKAALDQMWQSELHLRQGQPDLALPYEYRALDFIKQVQQAGRIYLARVGLQLPPIDPARRLSGDRTGVRDRRDRLPAAVPAREPVLALWRVLERAEGGVPAAEVAAAIDGFERWLAENPAALSDPLALLAALDPLRRDPGCAECAERVEALLWPLLPVPAAAVDLRTAPDPAGRAYLDALERAAVEPAAAQAERSP